MKFFKNKLITCSKKAGGHLLKCLQYSSLMGVTGSFYFLLLHLYVMSQCFIIRKNSEAIFSLKQNNKCKEDWGLENGKQV